MRIFVVVVVSSYAAVDQRIPPRVRIVERSG
jgi:hypothetical protein